MKRTVLIDLGDGPEDVPVEAAPYVLAGLPDFIDMRNVSSQTDVREMPLAPQISADDTSARSIAEHDHVEMSEVYAALKTMTYDPAWPQDLDAVARFNAARDAAPGVIKRAVREAREQRNEGALTFAQMGIALPLTGILLFLGITIGVSLRNDILSVAMVILTIPVGFFMALLIAIIIVALLPARAPVLILATLVVGGVMGWAVFSGMIGDWSYALEDWARSF